MFSCKSFATLTVYSAYKDFIAWLRSDRDIMGFMERMNGGGQHRAYLRVTDDDSGGEVASDDCDSDLDEERGGWVGGVGGVAGGSGNGNSNGDGRAGGRAGGRAAESDDDTSRVMELAAMAATTGGDEFMAVKPWIGAVKVRRKKKSERASEIYIFIFSVANLCGRLA
jgi:hypothetical protein